MPNENQLLNNMLHAARQRLCVHDPLQIARSANVALQDDHFRFMSLGQEIRVSHQDWKAMPSLPHWQLLTLLHYLDMADGTPLSGKLMPFARCRNGMVRGGGFDRDAEEIIRTRLGGMDESLLTQRCLSLGAEIIPSNADLCAKFSFAPRYPLWLKMWFADEDFPASGRLFVDESADHYLSVEDAVTAGTLLLELLTGGSDWL